MTIRGRIFAGILLAAATYVLSALGSLAIDPTTPPWGLIVPFVFLIPAGLLAIPVYRIAPGGALRWIAVGVQLALPAYIAFTAIHFHITY